jgi:hypothetical protein
MKELKDLIQSYQTAYPSDKGCILWAEMRDKFQKEIEAVFSREIALYKNRLFIQMALNHYFHDANSNLERENLGDIERDNYELQKEEALRILNDFENDII